MLWCTFITWFLVLLSTILAVDPASPDPKAPASPAAAPSQKGGTSTGQPKIASDSTGPSKPVGDASAADTGSGSGSGGDGTQKASSSVFGAGCRWDPTTSNIEQVSFQFRTGQAPPSTWFSDLNDATTSHVNSLQRRADDTAASTPPKTAVGDGHGGKGSPGGTGNDLLDPSYHTRLIDVLTFRARYGSFGSSLNSAGCALPAFSERLAQLEQKEGEIVNRYTQMHKPVAGSDDVPNAMFFWAGISNYDPAVKSDLIQTVVFYGDGCAANPRQGLCIYAAEYSNFRYSPEDHMCMGSNMPVFYPVDTPMTVVYRTQRGFRTQESWIDGKMVSYLRSAGDQVMNSFVITQECKTCTWPLSEQVYENIVIKFSEPEPHFDALGLCTGGATLKSQPRMQDGGKVWVIDEVRVPSGKHVTSTTDESDADEAGSTGGTSAEQGGKKSGEQSGGGKPTGKGTEPRGPTDATGTHDTGKGDKSKPDAGTGDKGGAAKPAPGSGAAVPPQPGTNKPGTSPSTP